MQLVKSFLGWLKDSIIETLNQIWTLLGMFIAWVLLEGSARVVIGYSILFSLALWLLTLYVREPREKDIEDESSD